MLIDNLYEQVQLASGVTEHKFVIGNAIVTRRTVGGPQVYYLHKDQQGSTTAITNLDGNPVQQLLYDPWGRQYQVSAAVLTYSSQATTKGYTGHDMVNDFEAIHTGGRSYNPVLGRFMQADPFIQQASNLQSFNRYAYVLNNPMSYTDPTGYFFKALNKLFGKFAPLVSIAIAIYMPGLNFLQGLNAVQIGAITGFVSGGVATGSLRGALTGAISGAAFGSLHNWKSNLIAKGIDYGRIAAHGMVGGISSVLSGGKFGHGFAAAGFTQAASEIGGEKLFVEGAESLPDRAANAIKAAVIGGSASVLSGGKFGNGAITGAFSRLLNDDASNRWNTERDRSVYAADDGLITESSWEDPNNHNKGWGYKIRLRAGENEFVYGHMDPASLVAELGATVKKGQYLGEYASPSNGRSNGPHLHFEHYKGGMLQDPVKYLDVVLPNAVITSEANRIRTINGVRRIHKGVDAVGPSYKWRCNYAGCN